MRLQGVTWFGRGDRGLQGVTSAYKELHRVTRGYSSLLGVTGGYGELQWVTRGYKGLQG